MWCFECVCWLIALVMVGVVFACLVAFQLVIDVLIVLICRTVAFVMVYLCIGLVLLGYVSSGCLVRNAWF